MREFAPSLTCWTLALALAGRQQHPGAPAAAVLPVWISTMTEVGGRIVSAPGLLLLFIVRTEIDREAVAAVQRWQQRMIEEMQRLQEEKWRRKSFREVGYGGPLASRSFG